MLRLNLNNKPRWIDLGNGVELLVRPLTTAIMMAARTSPASQAAVAQAEGDDALALTVAKILARAIVVDWKGVGDAAGKAIKLTPAGLDALLDVWQIFEQFQLKIIAPVMQTELEKNVSSPLPNGRSAGAGTTAKPAKRSAKPARRQ